MCRIMIQLIHTRGIMRPIYHTGPNRHHAPHASLRAPRATCRGGLPQSAARHRSQHRRPVLHPQCAKHATATGHHQRSLDTRFFRPSSQHTRREPPLLRSSRGHIAAATGSPRVWPGSAALLPSRRLVALRTPAGRTHTLTQPSQSEQFVICLLYTSPSPRDS